MGKMKKLKDFRDLKEERIEDEKSKFDFRNIIVIFLILTIVIYFILESIGLSFRYWRVLMLVIMGLTILVYYKIKK